MGAWGDRVGRRRVLSIGAAGFGAASLLAAYAVSVEMLIAARALMGVAGATLMPSTLALTAVLFPHPRQRATAIAVIIASVSGGTAIGPMMALATDMVVGAAPPERAGAAAAISTTAPRLGGALGIALLGSVIAAVYRSKVSGTAPVGTPETAVAALEDNLSATTGIAGRLPEVLAS